MSRLNTTLLGLPVVGGGLLGIGGGLASFTGILGLALIIVSICVLLFLFIYKKCQLSLWDKLAKDVVNISRQGNETSRVVWTRFKEALDAYKDKKHSPDDLPWFMIIGEPGSGKSEIFRQIELQDLDGYHDQHRKDEQGGTRGLQFWVKKEGLILDTAGALVTEDEDFHGLNTLLSAIKKYRKRRPINGVMIVIPADSLLYDTEEEVKEKAAKLKNALDKIKYKLNIRFPLHINITKCDLVYGFENLFDSKKLTLDRDQTFGWINDNEDRDLRVQTDDIIASLKETFSGIRDLSLHYGSSLIISGGGNRMSEMKDVYPLSSNMASLLPNLSLYLEKFQYSEHEKMPLFLRGVYFNCSVISKSAIDKQLELLCDKDRSSKALREEWISINRNRKKEKKNIFLQNAIKKKFIGEQNLVTHARQATGSIKFNQAIIIVSVALAVTVLSVISFISYRGLKYAIKPQLEAWSTLAGAAESGDYSQLAILEKQGAKVVYTGSQYIEQDNSEIKMKRVDFYDRLQDFCNRSISVSPIFRIFTGKSMPDKRLEAFGIAVDNGVISPMQNYYSEIAYIKPIIDNGKSILDDLQSIEDLTDFNNNKISNLIALFDYIRRLSSENNKSVNAEMARQAMSAYDENVRMADIEEVSKLSAILALNDEFIKKLEAITTDDKEIVKNYLESYLKKKILVVSDSIDEVVGILNNANTLEMSIQQFKQNTRRLRTAIESKGLFASTPELKSFRHSYSKLAADLRSNKSRAGMDLNSHKLSLLHNIDRLGLEKDLALSSQILNYVFNSRDGSLESEFREGYGKVSELINRSGDAVNLMNRMAIKSSELDSVKQKFEKLHDILIESLAATSSYKDSVYSVSGKWRDLKVTSLSQTPQIGTTTLILDVDDKIIGEAFRDIKHIINYFNIARYINGTIYLYYQDYSGDKWAGYKSLEVKDRGRKVETLMSILNDIKIFRRMRFTVIDKIYPELFAEYSHLLKNIEEEISSNNMISELNR